MCHILPVEHIPCKHTTIIYEHCIDAPKSKIDRRGPCSSIKEHARAILTRKLCTECGGPRFFARRGAIAERGWGTCTSTDLSSEMENEKADFSDANDSGYHSESLIDEGEEEDGFQLSPKTSALNVKSWKQRMRQRDVEMRGRYQSSSKGGHRPSWGPNLKQEPIDSFASRRHDSNGHLIPRSVPDDCSTSAPRRPKLAPLHINLKPQSTREVSTLLHPSSPTETTSPRPAISNSRPAFAFPISSKLKEKRPQPIRKSSTLLHPSTPPLEDEPHLQNATSFPFSSSLVCNSSPKRKSSTLLHPSPPVETPTVDYIPSHPSRTSLSLSSQSSHSTSSIVLPLRSPNRPVAFSVPPGTQLPSLRPLLYHRSSVLHSSMSDEEFDLDSLDSETENTREHVSLARKATITRARAVNQIRIRS